MVISIFCILFFSYHLICFSINSPYRSRFMIRFSCSIYYSVVVCISVWSCLSSGWIKLCYQRYRFQLFKPNYLQTRLWVWLSDQLLSAMTDYRVARYDDGCSSFQIRPPQPVSEAEHSLFSATVSFFQPLRQPRHHRWGFDCKRSVQVKNCLPPFHVQYTLTQT